MPRKTTFVAPCVLGDQPVTGWLLADGAVLHRAPLVDGTCDALWTVSDPASGACFLRARGGMGQALRDYRALKAAYGAQWPWAVVAARHRVHEQLQAWRRRGEVPALSLLNDGVPRRSFAGLASRAVH